MSEVIQDSKARKDAFKYPTNIKSVCLACGPASLHTKLFNHVKIGQGFQQGLACIFN